MQDFYIFYTIIVFNIKSFIWLWYKSVLFVVYQYTIVLDVFRVLSFIVICRCIHILTSVTRIMKKSISSDVNHNHQMVNIGKIQ